MSATLDPDLRAALALGVMRHLEFHTAYLEPPTRFQFALPEGRFLTVADAHLKRRRVLWFFGRAPVTPYRRVSTTLARPRRLPRDGAWFLGYDERQRRRALRDIEYAVGFAYGGSLGGADRQREPETILLDPLAAPERIPRPQSAERSDT